VLIFIFRQQSQSEKMHLEIDEMYPMVFTMSAVMTGSGVPGSLLAALLESCQILLAL
jgi:hypothetical protein